MKQELVKGWMTRDVVTVTSHTVLPVAHRLMTDNQIRRLPVMENGRLVGIITRGDVRGAEASDATSLSIWELHYLIAKIKVNKIMTHDPITVSQDATIGEAAQVMLDKKISGLPVVNGEGKLVGIITESDIFRIVVREWKEQAESPSREAVMVGTSPIL
jgi:acetoin utilization protein AcuB